MGKTFTHKSPYILAFCFLWVLQLVTLQNSVAQGNSVPIHEVNLTGKPNGIWNSEELNRNGSICGADKNDNCIQFNITLDRNAGGLEFAITGGPVPSGAMAYQIDCGPPTPVGQPICVSGVGPHVLTICMPGGAKNTFQVKSIAAFTPVPDIPVSGGCSAVLQAPIAFEESSVTWTDITGGGAYNKYLSCTSGCATPTITPDNNSPAFVDYVVCGQSVVSPCSDLPFCDTVRVFFFPPPVVAISPQPAIICPGSAGVELTGHVTGGTGNFSYFWTDSYGNVVGTSPTFLAKSVGQYSLEVRNENYPNCNKFSSSVTVVSNLSVNAGPDQLVCSAGKVALSGNVTAATGGIWSGGKGTFYPSNTALSAVYTPTAEELQNGTLTLTLTSTGNGTCAAMGDQVTISFYILEANIAGPPVICTGSTATLTASATGGQGTVSYQWSTGETTASISNKPAGTYTVTVIDGKGCSIQKTFTVTQASPPSALALSLQSTTCGNSNGVATVTGVTGGKAPYSFSLNGGTFQSSASFKPLSAGNHSLTVKDANGCTYTESFTLQNISGPSGVTLSVANTTCGNSNGSFEVTAVTDGTAPYTYSIDGANFQSSSTFKGLAAGTHTVTIKDANNCSFSQTVQVVNVSGPTAIHLNTVSSTCGASNGSIAVATVTGGTAPYLYSRDGVSFQSTTSFTGLLSDAYTITVKDANGCIFARTVNLDNVAGPTHLPATTKASTCGNPNGELSVSGVTGGTAPYTYSLNSGSFQSASLFSSLAAGDYAVTVKDANGCFFTRSFSISNVAGPTAASVTAAPTTCGSNNGTLTITNVAGGTAPYQYSKDGSSFQSSATFSGLEAGTYTLTVKDANGCTLTETAHLENVAGPSNLNLTATSSTCGKNNGSILITAVTGGTAPYAYSKDGTNFQASTSFANLTAGTHTITVKDANGCTYSRQIILTDVAGPTNLLADVTPSTCGSSNGTITVSDVTGGTAPYTFSRDGKNFQSSTTFTGLLAGGYSITVKDSNGCTFAKAYTLSNISGPTVVTTASQPASCYNNDGTITVGTVTGGTAPYTYSINGGAYQAEKAFLALAAGTYTVTAQDANGCTVTSSVTVNKSTPTAFVAATVSSTCGASNGSITVGSVSGGKSPYSYSRDGVNFQSAPSFDLLSAGSYTITVKDINGCTFSKAVTLTDMAGPTDVTASTVSSTCGASNGSLTVTAVIGGTAPYTYSTDGTNYQSSTTFAALSAGTYTITVKDANGCTYSETVEVTNIGGPTGIQLTGTATTCGNNNGSITISSVEGGTDPYSYSKDGVNFQASAIFQTLSAGSYTIWVKDAKGCILSQQIELKNIEGPSALSLSNTSSTCGRSNGTITVDGVTGGTAPFMFSLAGKSFQSNSTFTGVLAGSYTVTVKDANGCTFAQTVTVSDVSGPSGLTASSTSSTCGASNGILSITQVNGGTAPYTFSIDGVNFQASTNFTGLAAGQHSILVKDTNGCMFSTSFSVADNAGPTTVMATTLPATCADNDGSVSISGVTGGTAPYSYTINGKDFQGSTFFQSLASGTYAVTAKDANGCTVTTTVSVGQNIPTFFASTSKSSTCGREDGNITIGKINGGVAPYTYSRDGVNFQTSSTLIGFLAGMHMVTVKDANGCVYSQPVSVENTAGPTFAVDSKPSTCGGNNGSITISGVTGGVAPYAYSLDGVNFRTAASFTGLLAGSHTITVKDANGCLSSEAITVADIAGTTDVSFSTSASTCGGNNGSISIISVVGGTAPYRYSKDGVNFQTSASFSSLTAAAYTITVKDANGCVFSKEVEVKDTAGPNDFTLAITASACGNSNGSIQITGVKNGTAPYLFSLNGSAFQSAAEFVTVMAGEHVVTVKDANGCTFTKKVTVENIAGPTGIASSTQSSTCGASNGRITVTAVTGGTAPYSYSKDGVNFQTSPNFTALAAGEHTIQVKDAYGCTFSRSVSVTNIAGPTAVAATTQPASCADNDGSLLFTGVTGGSAPYTYSVDGGAFQTETTFTSLDSGTHSITAKDANGCEVKGTVTIQKNIPSGFAASAVASTCGNSNGSIKIGPVTGGTAPFTYSLDGSTFQASDMFSGLAAGSYTFTVQDSKGCIFSRSVILQNVAGPSDINASLQSSTCGRSNGGIAITGVTGGTAPYTYRLEEKEFQSSTVFPDLKVGTYSITVKDGNGCTFTKSFTITDVTGPTALVATSQSASCHDNDGIISVSLVTGGTAPYTYSINGGPFQAATTFSSLASGMHVVIARDANGCDVSASVSVNQNIPVSFVSTPTASTCGNNNGTVTIGDITGGFAPYTYSKDGVNFQTTPTLTGLAAGLHSVTIRDARGCKVSEQVQVENIAGPTDFTSAVVSSTCGSSNGGLTIYTVIGGTAPYSYSLNGTTYQTSSAFTGLLAGEFVVRVKDSNGCVYSATVTVPNISGPALAGATKASTCGNSNGTLTLEASGGTAPFTYSLEGAPFQTDATFSNLTAGTYRASVKDANGCTSTISVNIANTTGPGNLILSAISSTCTQNNGSVSVQGVTGGTAPYMYSLDGESFQSSPSFSSLLAGTYTIIARDANGCTFSKHVTVADLPAPSELALSIRPSTCGYANAEVSVAGVTGGTGPYTFSIDGIAFQSSSTFTGLNVGAYSITVKDTNGCTFLQEITIENIAGPSGITAQTQASSCGNSNGSITVASVSGGTAPYSYSKDGFFFQQSPVLSGLAAGVYSITVRDANGCTFSQQLEVGNVDGPDGLTLSSTPSTCGNSNGAVSVDSVTRGTAPYTFAINRGEFQSAATFMKVLAGSHTISVRDANGCTFTKEVEVGNVAGPSDFSVSTQSSTCGGNNGNLSIANVTGGTAPYTFSLDGVNFQTSSSFSSLKADTYIVTVKDANGCSFAKTSTVVDMAGPTAVAAVTQPASCLENDGGLSVTGVQGGTAPYTYAIDGGAFQNSTSFAGLGSGVHAVTARDANGCETTVSVRVDQKVPKAFTSSTVSTTCDNSNGSLTITSVAGGTAPYSYSKDGVNYQTSTSFGDLLAGTYTITIKDAKGCTYSGSVAVGNLNAPSFSVTANASTCGKANAQITVSNVTGGKAPYTFSIDGTSFQEATTFSGLAAGTYLIITKDVNGCLSSQTIAVEDIAGPSEMRLSAVFSKCGQNNGSVTVNSVVGGTAPYTYSSNGSAFQPSATFTALGAGDYSITVKDANGCLFSQQIKLDNIAGPSALAITSTSSTCGENNGSITVGGITGGTHPYVFAIDGGNFQSDPFFASVLPGEHSVSVQDANGCTYTSKVTVTDIAGPSGLSVETKASTCGGRDGEITITSVAGGTAPYQYSRDGVNFLASATFEGLPAGYHTLTLKDANGCLFAKNIVIENREGPTAIEINTIPATCADNDASLTITGVTGGAAPYTYSINGSTYQNGSTFTALTSGSYTITARDANGCVVKATVIIGKKAPTAFTSSTLASTCGNSNGSITVNSVTGGTAPYLYRINGGSFQSQVTFIGLAAGTHAITVKDASGCLHTAQVTVTDVQGPTALTALAKNTTCGDKNGEVTVTAVSGGTAPYTYSLDGVTFQASATFTQLEAGTHIVTAKDANGCLVTKQFTLINETGPSEFSVTLQSSTCGTSNGQVTVTEVTGGTGPYTFSKDGTNFQTSATFSALLAGTYTMFVKDSNGCTFSKKAVVENLTGPGALSLSSTAATCGNSNGSIEASVVSQGTAPYLYSLNGGAFQAASTFNGLAAGTYTVTVKDANGCTLAKEGKVRDVAGPTAVTASSTPASCAGTDGRISVSAVTGGTAPYTYSINGSTFQQSSSFTTLASGTYTLTARDLNGCTVANSVTVGKSAPTDISSTVVASTCGQSNGSMTVLSVTGGAAPYSYSLDGSAFQASSTFEGLAAGIFTITVRDANNCVFAEQVHVTDRAGVTGFTTSIKGSSCGTSNGEIAVTSVEGGTAPYAYALNGAAFSTVGTFSNLSSGTYTLAVKDANGCVSSQEAVISATSGPTAFNTTSKSSTCGGTNGQITIGDIAGGIAPFSFSKDGITFQTNPVFTGLAAGSYTFTVKDASGCTFTKAAVVEAVVGPSEIAFEVNSATCAGNNGSVTIKEITGGTAPYRYSLNSGPLQAAATFSALAAGSYTLAVQDANGCTFSKEVQVTDSPAISAITTSTSPATCSAKGSITITSTTGGTAPYSYSLDGISYQASVTFTALASQEYKVFVKDANGCTAFFNATVTDSRIQEAKLIAAATSCGHNDGAITVTSVMGGQQPYTYSLDGASFQTSATFNQLAAGNYTITIKDAAGCLLTKTQEVGSNGGVTTFTATASKASCGNKNGSISISQISGGQSPYTFSVNGSTFTSSSDFTELAARTYKVAVKDARGCVLTKEVSVGSSAPITNVSYTTVAAGCGQSTGQVVVKEVTGGTAPYTYSFDGSTFSSTSTFNGATSGTYQLTVKDANNCTFVLPVKVNQTEARVATVTHVLCAGQANGAIQLTTKGGEGKAQFSINNGRTFQTDSIFTNLSGGKYQVVVKFSAGCVLSLGDVEIKEPKPVQAQVTALTNTINTENMGSAAITSISGGTAPYRYQLDKGSITTDSVFTQLGAGRHTVLVIDKQGCTTDVSFSIEALQDIEIPTGFTPNGDGLNDQWEIRNLSVLYPECKVTVYNRWGSPVFESTGYKKPWDGTYNGQALPVGTYYCIIELGNSKPPLKKSLTIMR